MIKILKHVLSSNIQGYGRNNLTELIHMEFGENMVRCMAIDGHRIHENHIPAVTSVKFVCHICPPRLAAHSRVKISLDDDFTAYIEFGDVRFATKQPSEPLDIPGLDKVQKMIEEDVRFEVVVNSRYLLDAAKTMRGSQRLALNFGSPSSPVVLYPANGMGTKTYTILPIRHRYLAEMAWMCSSECLRNEQSKELKFIQKRLESLPAQEPAIGGEQEPAVWEKAISLKNALCDFLGEGDCV